MQHKPEIRPKRSSGSQKPPSYRRHRASGQAVTTISGRDFYLGLHGTAASRREYDRVIAEWLAGGRCLPDRRTTNDVRVVEIATAYVRWAKEHYRRPDGTATSEVANVRASLKPLAKLYGRTPAGEFGPLALQSVRTAIVESGICRRETNKRVGRIKAMFKWAVSKELVEPSVLLGLQSVSGLRAGRSAARETDPIRPVPESDVAAIEPHVSRQVWAIVQLQLYTAARAGELTAMRAVDIDTSGRVWTYRPTQHKGAWREHDRTIYLGPKAQAIVQPFLTGRPVDAPVFSAREAEAGRHSKATTHRRKDQRPNAKKTGREVGHAYSTDSLRRAIHRACEKAGVSSWSPHRLRHNAATYLRREFGLEAAQIMLGHATANVTQIYAERDTARALELAERIG